MIDDYVQGHLLISIEQCLVFLHPDAALQGDYWLVLHCSQERIA